MKEILLLLAVSFFILCSFAISYLVVRAVMLQRTVMQHSHTSMARFSKSEIYWAGELLEPESTLCQPEMPRHGIRPFRHIDVSHETA